MKRKGCGSVRFFFSHSIKGGERGTGKPKKLELSITMSTRREPIGRRGRVGGLIVVGSSFVSFPIQECELAL